VAGYTVTIKGVNEVIRSLKQYQGAVDDLKDANAAIGNKVAVTAKATAPYLSGRLAGTVRANRAMKKVQIKAGGAAVPYAGVIEYGWPARNIEAQPYLRRAAWDNREYAKQQYSVNLQAIARKYIGGSSK
jgi:hypothetical protein